MADDITIDLGMDPATYLAGAQQITGANTQLQQSFNNVAVQSSMLQRAIGAATPSRAALLAWGGMAAAAANTEQQLSGMAAQATVTHVNVDRLAGGMRQLARDMPLGNQGARQIVQQFTQMGVASAGTERQVQKLATSTAKLSGATGEGPAALAQGMVDLSRATGNTNLDPRRFESLGDSLTTISAKSGASATGILQFSKSIAPMAQAAGIGATGVLGISSAFARMGEDGVGASTAVNKMLTDLNRSVRDGTPEMATYAQIVGKTSDQFERLFKANPTEALTEVTEALAKNPAAAPRQLEMLGLDGVRTSRALTALSAQGGIRGAVADATAAYGSGSTEAASKAAFGGLNDSLTELTSSSQQLAEAFGRPLLGPLTAFTNALKIPVNIARGVTESGPVQKGLQTLAMAGVALAGARALLGPLTAAGLTRQALTSTPLRALAAGYTAGRGIPAAGEGSTFLSRYGAGSRAAAEAGRLGNVGRRAWDWGLGFGEGMGPRVPGPAGYSAMDRARMGLGGIATLTQANLRMMTGSLYNGATGDPLQRRMAGPGMISTPWRGFGNELRAVWSGAHNLPMSSLPPEGPGADRRIRAFNQANPDLAGIFSRGVQGGVKLDGSELSAARLKGVGAALDSFQVRLLAAGQNTNAFGRTLLSLGGLGLGMGRMGGAAVAGTARMGARLGGALMGMAGGPIGLAMMGGLGIVQMAQASSQSRKDADAEFYNRDIASTLNSYRDSIGKATGPAVTHASLNDTLGRNLAAQTRTMEQATTVTAEDRALAGTGRSTRTYTGATNAAVAAQIRAINPMGLAPDEMQAIKVDLLRQYKDPAKVNQILGQVGPGGGTNITGSGGQDYSSALNFGRDQFTGSGFSHFLHATGLNTASLGDYDRSLQGPKWLQSITGFTAAGGALSKNSLGANQQEQIKALSDAMQQRYTQQSQTYGADYAEQERIKGAQEMLRAARDTGNADVFRQVSKQVTGDLTGKEGGYELRTDQIDDIGKTLSGLNKDWGKGYADLQAKQRAAGGSIDANEIQSAVSKNLAAISPMMSRFFDARGGTGAQQAVAASLAAPGDVGKLDKAASAMVDAAQKSGTSMLALGENATKAANNLSEASQEFAIVKAAQARGEMVMARQQLSMAPSAAMSQQYQYQSMLATQDARNPTQQAEKRAAQQTVLGMDQSNQQRLIARLQAQREYEVQVTRTTEDANRQRLYSITDFNKQVARTEQDAGIQRQRAQDDFHTSSARAEQDYNIARAHQIRDFNTSMARAEQDYLKTRTRAIRDFNISMKRMVEDAAKSIYDPYARIQTKATYDAQNLMLNLREQNEAMAKQKAQLDRLRQMGLSGQAVDQLGLGKAENAQQLNNLMADATTDPRVLGQLNDLAKQRGNLAGAMVNDPSNTEAKRAREDFNKSLKDMGADMKTNLDRARADLRKSLNDQNEAFGRSQARAAADFNKSMNRSADDLARNLARMQSDQATAMDRQRDALKVGLTRMGEDIRRADETISGDMGDLAAAVSAAMAGKSKTYQRFVTNDTKTFVKQMQNEVIPAMRRVANELGIDLPSTTSGGVAKNSNGGASTVGGKTNAGLKYAEGGRIAGHSPHPKADNIPIWATAGEFMHPVDVVKHYGENTLEAMRQKKIPKEALQGYADGGLIGFGLMLQKRGYAVSEHPKFGGVHPVHAPGSQHYNKRGPGGGGAIDVNADPFNSPFKNEKQAIDSIVGMARLYGLRTLWQVAGHFNHAHFDIAGGADMLGKGYSPTSGAGMAALAGMFDVHQVMKGINQKRGGWYGQLRNMVTAQLIAQYGASAAGGPGDTGAHGKGAKANQAIARSMLAQFGWGQDQMDPLIKLWNGESGWNERADNPTSDAYGIPQALPGSKMASAGADWRTNPATQIRWGLGYIKNRPDYGSPAKAWAMWQSRTPHWYDKGGKLNPGSTMVQNDTGKVEHVLTDEQWAGVRKLSELAGTMLTADQGRGLAATHCTHMTVNNHQTYSYDQRNDFGGAVITVQAEDPNQMARKLEQKQTRDRLTETRGVRRNR